MPLVDLSLKLFNVVPTSHNPVPAKAHVDFNSGIIIAQDACWARHDILNFLDAKRLSGEDLNKTWYTTWANIDSTSKVSITSTIMGYLNGLGNKLNKEIQVPSEVIGIEDLGIKFVTVQAIPESELGPRALNMLQSGIALKSQTITDLFDVLSAVKYQWTGKEDVRNKEAIVMLADRHKVYPRDPVDVLRYTVFKATGSAMLIKSGGAVRQIKESAFSPTDAFESCGEARMAEVFNRFKPLFLAYKSGGDSGTKKMINRIAKLSKTKHKPLPVNALNEVTSRSLKNEDLHWLKNATTFALFKALQACYTRMNNSRTIFAYHIRNGKSWYKEAANKANTRDINYNFDLIANELKSRVTTEGHKIFIPEGIEYALPTSEKMMVGNVPTGTKFTASQVAAGIYWENSWGARDLDLSSIDVSGNKVGWNSYHSGQDSAIKYSGDITNAPNGAVEYLNVSSKLENATMVLNNVYYGQDDCKYKVIVGKGANITSKYMQDPGKVWVDEHTQSVKKESIIGLFLPEEGDKVSFVMLNTVSGSGSASSSNVHTIQFNKAMVEQYSNQFTLNLLLEYIGFELTDTANDATIDLSLDKLERDTFVKLFS